MLLGQHEGRRQAPAFIGRTRKSRDPRIEVRAVTDACRAAVGVDLPLPVLLAGEQLGWCLGNRKNRTVMFLPERRRIDGPLGLMPFSNYDAIIAAMTAGRRYSSVWAKGFTTAPVAFNWYDLWPVAGNPIAGLYGGTASNSKQHTDADTGAIQHFGNVSTYTKHLTGVWGSATAGATQPVFVLYDRCVTYEACPIALTTTTFTQTNSPVSARYSTGSDSGLKIILTGQTVLSATATFASNYVYVNQAGTTARSFSGSNTTTNIIVSAAAPTATLGARVISPAATTSSTLPTSFFMPLLSGDVGVQSLTSYIWSAANTGTLCVVLGRPLAYLPLATAGVVSQIDTVMMTAALERIFDGAALSYLAYFPVATAATLMGGFDAAWN